MKGGLAGKEQEVATGPNGKGFATVSFSSQRSEDGNAGATKTGRSRQSEDVEKSGPSRTAGGKMDGCGHFGKQAGRFLKC